MFSLRLYIYFINWQVPDPPGPLIEKLVDAHGLFLLQVVRCRMTACAAVLHQPCGHAVCRSHADCGIQMDDILVWHPDNCLICYDLISTLASDSSSQAVKTSARATLKLWVGGFARNVKARKPYVLSEDYCRLIYPNAKSSAAVPRQVAAPIIADIAEIVELNLVQDTDIPDDPDPIEDNVTALTLDIEPMVFDEPDTGKVVSEAGGSGAKTSLLSPSFFPTSNNFSFLGFEGNHESSPRSLSVPAKVKSQKRPLVRTRQNPTLPGSSKPKKAPLPRAPSDSTSTAPMSQDPGVQSSPLITTTNLDPEALTNMLSRVVTEQISSILSAVTRRLDTLESGLPQQQQFLIPDASKLPPFTKNNPWKMALHCPFTDGMLTIEGFGTRPIEDFEFFPPGLQFPFPGFARLTEEALVRLDKVPKETVIFPKEQAQSVWVRTLNEWGCTNTMLTPHKSTYTMFLVDEQTPTPCVTKMVELALQAVTEDKPLPQLRETDPTSLLFPSDNECWLNIQSTFTSGKLSADCASTQFSERLPRLPETLIRLEFESRSRFSRSLNISTMAEMFSLTYDEEHSFKVMTKATLQSLLADCYDFLVTKRRCRKHVLSEATIRHEPNKLIKASAWGPDLFPEDMVNSVLSEAARVNQSLKVRWGLTPKRKFEQSSIHSRGRKRLRPYSSTQFRQPIQVVQSAPVSQGIQPSTSKSQPQVKYVLVPENQVASNSFTSPVYNPVYESRFSSQGYQRGRGPGSRGSFQNRSKGRYFSRGKGSRGGRGGKTSNY
ncbi:uncharacterized protein [Palaemon carinicauda]|uniref:uncharacterized protein n=1 Tax=Palaemon carinicauda TaxID=392227 RepID=UPI0035B656C1